MTFRFARHTNNLQQLKSFYTEVLGLELLGNFENHDGYDGIFVGKSEENWHLEFTSSGQKATFNFGEEDLLVFYPGTLTEYDSMLKRLHQNGICFIEASNPYWNQNGKLFLDPDGYRLIVSPIKALQ